SRRRRPAPGHCGPACIRCRRVARCVDDSDVDVWCGAVSAPDRRLAVDARRAATQEVLADYVALPAAALTFERSCQACGHPSHGKPRLVGSYDLSFNV